MPLISICIPAFKRTEFLKRLLDSISIQNFQDFDVVITDDSGGDEVYALTESYAGKFVIHYFRNKSQLGTPGNWNEAIRNANGDWIKLMHDDDWLTSENSLTDFAAAIRENPGTGFIFSAYINRYLDTGESKSVKVSSFRLRQLRNNSASLFSQNIIGPPSVVVCRKDLGVDYDEKLKWLVDIDFYIRCLEKTGMAYIDKELVNVGVGKEQVTQDCFRQRQVEIPETFYLFNKLGFPKLKNVLVYDGWWRLMRNLEIRVPEDITGSGYNGEIPAPVRSMIKWQQRLPAPAVKKGVFSKLFMFLNYLSNYNRITR